ncbi:MAG TPA: amylo-alpha-1,6-glucosidase [Gemmatimonadaceae bacterium]|nr:amylo-alpha-1,6-glucosidase [Gemmatimonadaceae bacterium]
MGPRRSRGVTALAEQPNEVVREDLWAVETSTLSDERTRVLKSLDTFGVFDRYGDIRYVPGSQQGLYHAGTRFLSRFSLTLDGHRPVLLNSWVKADNSLLVVEMTLPDRYEGDRLKFRRDTLHVFRARLLRDGVLHEHVRLMNYGDVTVSLTLAIDFGGDFADVFEVRGIRRSRRGLYLPARIGDREVELGYDGLDHVRRVSRIAFDRKPDVIDEDSVEFRLELVPRAAYELFTSVSCELDNERRVVTDYRTAVEASTRQQEEKRSASALVETSHAQFNEWIERSIADLHMLTSRTADGPYPYAGVPWFSTPFGRDGIITALEMLWVEPQLARGVLSFLAARQATAVSAEQDAEPGKILHELREGEMAALGEVPFAKYYGSVDSTPLFVMLAGAYYERTGDVAFIEQLWPAITRGLDWIDHFGDRDGDGYVEYERHSERGLEQQGWKDSFDSVFHADGSMARGPIALCEVQGYVYAARMAVASLAGRLGHRDLSASQLRKADELRAKFNRDFWCPELGTFALALDGQKRPCRVRTSNAGQALATGIVAAELAHTLADTLMSESSFNGWGVRTVASTEARFNPMSYHNGSLWPHDNALIALGLSRYGRKDDALRILTGLFEASTFMDLNRLPELFCGFPRYTGQGPTLYPVACSPQAWASAAVFQLLSACVGLTFSPSKPQVQFDHPVLPPYLNWVKVRNLRVGGGVVDLVLTRHPNDVSINVNEKAGDVDVAILV